MLLQEGGEGHRLPVGVGARNEIIARDAEKDGKIGTHCRPNGRQDLQWEAGAVLPAPAVLVGAQIGQRGEKLGDQIAGGAYDLHAVKSGPFGPEGALRPAVDDGPELFSGGLPGGLPGIGGINGGRSQGLHSLREKFGFCISAGVVELHHRFGPTGMHALSKHLQFRKKLIVFQAEEVGTGGAEVIEPGPAHDHQAGASRSPLPVEGAKGGRGHALGGIVGLQGRHDDPVFQFHAIDGDGPEQSLHTNTSFWPV